MTITINYRVFYLIFNEFSQWVMKLIVQLNNVLRSRVYVELLIVLNLVSDYQQGPDDWMAQCLQEIQQQPEVQDSKLQYSRGHRMPMGRIELDTENMKHTARTELDTENMKYTARTELDTESMKHTARTELDTESMKHTARTELDTESTKYTARTELDTGNMKYTARTELDAQRFKPRHRLELDEAYEECQEICSNGDSRLEVEKYTA